MKPIKAELSEVALKDDLKAIADIIRTNFSLLVLFKAPSR